MPTNTIAVKLPLEIDEDTGSFVVYTQEQLLNVVDQNIKMVLLTNPGEKLFNNDFGVGLRRYLFLSENEVVNGIAGDQRFPPLRQFIRTQIENYIPYITIEDLRVSTQQNLMNVNIKYYVNNSSTAAEFNLTISDVSL